MADLVGCKESQLNVDASILTLNDLPENPLLLHPITSSINRKKHTMATLYGNDLAMHHILTYKDRNYPAGAILYEVSWSQKSDSLWFGANIPRNIFSVEQVAFDDLGKPVYKLYKGGDLHEDKHTNDKQRRLDFIISQEISVSP